MLHQDIPVRIGLCTDTHFWPKGPDKITSTGRIQPQQHSEQIQSVLLESLREANLDLVIHLGDLTCGGGGYDMTEALFQETLLSMHDSFKKQPAPFYALPGNHDCPPGGGDWSFFENLYGLGPRLGSTIDLPHVRLVLLNTQGHTPAQIEEASTLGDPISGWVDGAELARLDDALMTAGERPVLLFTHQLLQPWSNERPWVPLYGVENAEQVLALMAQHGNVRGVFQGHAHLFDLQSAQIGSHPCHFVVTPSVIEYPMAWLLLEISAGQLSIQMLRLPLPELAQASCRGGGGQAWRAGKAAWQQTSFPLE